MSDRLLVMHEGRVTAELSRADATEERVMFAATGQQPREQVDGPMSDRVPGGANG
jgi:rhamnose transport system ATP-binding protein